MLFGGSVTSLSVTCEANTVAVQLSPCVKSVGLMVNVVAPPLTPELPVSCVPDVAHAIENQVPATVTGSLNVIVTLLFKVTPAAPFAGVVLCTVGDASTLIVNEQVPDTSTPPLAVPPLSRTRSVMFAVPVAPATGVNVSVPFALTAGPAVKSPGLLFAVTSNVRVWLDSLAGPGLMPVAQPGNDAAPRELSAMTLGPQLKLGASLTGLTVIVTVAVFDTLFELSLAV